MYPIAEADIDPADLNDRVRTDSESMTSIDNPDTSDGGEEAMMGAYEGVTLIEEAAASISTPYMPEEAVPLIGEAEPTWADGFRALTKIHMAPKAKAVPVRSQRLTAILEDIKDQKKKAQQLLTELRSKKRNEERRHRRIIRKASMLGASELMEIAGLRRLTLQQLAEHAEEMGVSSADASSNSAPPAAPPADPVPPEEDL